MRPSVGWQGLGLRANPAIQASIRPTAFPRVTRIITTTTTKPPPPNPSADFMTECRRHAQLLAGLQSINNSVAQLTTIGVSLVTIIELLKQPTLHRSDGSDREARSNAATTTVPLIDHLDAEYCRFSSSRPG